MLGADRAKRESSARVGHGLKGGESGGDDKGRGNETSVFLVVRRRPESERAEAVKGETEQNALAVSEASRKHRRGDRHDEVGAETVNPKSQSKCLGAPARMKDSLGDLKHGRLQLGDGEESLRLLVEDIDERVL